MPRRRSNLPWVNPAVWKEAFDTGGQSLVAGAGHFVDDVMHNGGRPRQVDKSPFTVGKNLAATPCRVVMRNELVELLMYEPQTELVHAQPIVCSPPWINKYYIMDLAPGRSFIEYAVQHGFTVFCISYRNPDESMRAVSWDDYLRLGLMASLDEVQRDHRIAGRQHRRPLPRWHDVDNRSRAPRREGRVRARRMDDASPTRWWTSACRATSASSRIVRAWRGSRRTSPKRGFLEASSMAQTFDWLRGNDLVWSYVVNNWYMGKTPPPFDLLAWNGDSTNMPAAMHTQYLRACYVDNLLIRPGEFRIGDTPIDLRKIKQPLYVLGAENDHIAPWKGSFLLSRHVGGEVRYTLTTSGHVAGIVNPPGNAKAAYWTQPRVERNVDADTWRETANRVQGSWWDDWVEWAAARSGEMVAPPKMPRSEPGPGKYVVGEEGRAFRSGAPRGGPDGSREPAHANGTNGARPTIRARKSRS